MYATLLGGEAQDGPAAIAVDAAGKAYVAGYTSSKFPVTEGALQTTRTTAGAPFLAKFDPSSGSLLWATYLGADTETIYALAIDPFTQTLVVAGDSRAAAFPMTSDALRTKQENGEGFLLKLNDAGTQLVYSTFLGAEDKDSIRAMDIDAQGNIYLAGQTYSGGLPVTQDASQPKRAGANAFLMKLNNPASAILHCTYLGGNGTDTPRAMRVDSAGNVLLVGDTSSADFPVTAGAPQPAWPGGAAAMFLTVFSGQDMSRMTSTYLDAKDKQYAGMALDPGGDPWLLFTTKARDLPVTDGAVQKNLMPGGSDAYLLRLNSLSTTMVYASYFGGAGSSTDEQVLDLAVDGSGNLYVTGVTSSSNFPVTEGVAQIWPGGLSGRNAFVAKLDSTGKSLLFSAYLGGSGDDRGTGIALDTAGNVYISGTTGSADFPVTPDALQPKFRGVTDAFVAKLSSDGSALQYAIYLGGSGQDTGAALALGPGGEVYLTGATASPNFPVTEGAQQSQPQGTDIFVSKINADGQALAWSARVGGSGQDSPTSIALDGSGYAYVTGATDSPDFPTTEGAFQRTHGQSAPGASNDAFVFKLGSDGNSLVYSTLLGGNSEDRGTPTWPATPAPSISQPRRAVCGRRCRAATDSSPSSTPKARRWCFQPWWAGRARTA